MLLPGLKEGNEMKLLVQSDDYGITPGVSSGIIYGIKHGMIRNTGLFANMPWTEECVEMIRPYLTEIAFGIDLNISTGRPLSRQEDITTLVQEGGSFHSGWESRKLDGECEDGNHCLDQEVEKEYELQIQKFIDLVGGKPDYIHGHAYMTERIIAIQKKLADRYNIPYSREVYQKITGNDIFRGVCPWYVKPATIENQMRSSLSVYLNDHMSEILAKDIDMLIGHMGFVDAQLVEMSSYNFYRMNDLAAVLDQEILHTLLVNHVELITYKDLK